MEDDNAGNSDAEEPANLVFTAELEKFT